MRTTSDVLCAALLVSASTRTPRSLLCASDVISAQDLRRFRDASLSSRRVVASRFGVFRWSGSERCIEFHGSRRFHSSAANQAVLSLPCRPEIQATFGRRQTPHAVRTSQQTASTVKQFGPRQGLLPRAERRRPSHAQDASVYQSLRLASDRVVDEVVVDELVLIARRQGSEHGDVDEFAQELH